MADGDIFRNGLGHYKKLYEWLCESKASMYECTRIAIKALKQDLQKKGDLPIILARNIGERLSQIISVAGENNSVDWGSANMEIEKIVQVNGRHDVKELILCAAKSFLCYPCGRSSRLPKSAPRAKPHSYSVTSTSS